MRYGILDETGWKRVSQDLREADFQDSIGNHELARRLRRQVDDLRKLDFEICKMQIQGVQNVQVQSV